MKAALPRALGRLLPGATLLPQPGTGLTVKIAQPLWDAWRAYLLQDATERFAYAMGHLDAQTFVITRLVLPPDEAYLSRSPGNVSLSGDYVTEEVYTPFADSDCNGLVNSHSHPFGAERVWYSGVDDQDDRVRLRHEQSKLPLAKAAHGQPGVQVHSLSFVFDQTSFDARHLDARGQRFVSIERLVVVGEHLQVLFPSSSPRYRSASEEKARRAPSLQQRSFGTAAREAAGDVRVAVAGVGGVGSSVAELLARLGVRDITLIDADHLEPSNLARFQGAGESDVGRLKVGMLAERLGAQFTGLHVHPVPATIYSAAAMTALQRADVVIGCVDNTAARAFLSRLCVRYALPLFDTGAQIIGNGPDEAHPVWRIGLIIPGLTACGDCSPLALYDRKRASEEFLDPLTNRLAKAKGYLADAPDEQGAAVYALNLALVGALGLALQNLITPHRPGAHYLGNGIEFDPGFSVSHERICGNEDCWLANVRVPLGHPLARPGERCPHCHPRLWGSLGTHSMLHPACSEQAREPVLPDASKYLAHIARQPLAADTDNPAATDEESTP